MKPKRYFQLTPPLDSSAINPKSLTQRSLSIIEIWQTIIITLKFINLCLLQLHQGDDQLIPTVIVHSPATTNNTDTAVADSPSNSDTTQYQTNSTAAANYCTTSNTEHGSNNGKVRYLNHSYRTLFLSTTC